MTPEQDELLRATHTRDTKAIQQHFRRSRGPRWRRALGGLEACDEVFRIVRLFDENGHPDGGRFVAQVMCWPPRDLTRPRWWLARLRQTAFRTRRVDPGSLRTTPWQGQLGNDPLQHFTLRLRGNAESGLAEETHGFAILRDAIMVGTETPPALQGYTPVTRDGHYLMGHTLGFKNPRLVEYQFRRDGGNQREQSLDQAFILPGAYGNDFYHVLIDSLPLLALYQELGLDCPIVVPNLPIQSQPGIAEVLSLGLRAYGIPEDRIVPAGDLPQLRIRTAFSPAVSHGRPAILRRLARHMVPLLGGGTSTPERRLYISRRHAGRRRLQNEQAVVGMLEARGFQAVELEHLGFQDQARLFLDSKTVVAPHGGGLSHLLFMPAGGQVLELMTMQPPKDHFRFLCKVSGQDYRTVQCEPMPSEGETFQPGQLRWPKWRADLGAIQRQLDEILCGA